MGKMLIQKKMIVEKCYLLWNLRGVVSIFSAEQVDKVSYHTIQKIVAETKNIFTNSNLKDDNCRCTKCEN